MVMWVAATDVNSGAWGQAPRLSTLPPRWRRAPRRWGHPLHSICSYFAMFPPQVPSVFIEWLTRPGDVVYDPFCGRGTVALEAARRGRVAYGSDLNPLAVALTQAKVRVPSGAAALSTVDRLETKFRRPTVRDVPADIAMLYSRRTLEQIVYLKESLNGDAASTRLVAAMTLGLLHGNHSKNGATRGFSVSMPNTFAMAPNYVRGYIEQHKLVPPDVDVFEMLRARIQRLSLPSRTVIAGEAWRADASADESRPDIQADLVFTSPPYLEVIKYAKYNWVRLWFLGEDPREIDSQLMASSSLPRYLDFMAGVLSRLATTTKRDGVVCFVIGDVRRGDTQLNLAKHLWETVARPAGWKLHAVVNDRVPAQRKVTRIWKGNEGRATKVDRILVLSPPAGTRRLPSLPRMTWNSTSWIEDR
jgi:16S rRNA G966 N2-methylase RsmD